MSSTFSIDGIYELVTRVFHIEYWDSPYIAHNRDFTDLSEVAWGFHHGLIFPINSRMRD